MTLRAQPHHGDEAVVALLHGQMHAVRRAALAGAASVGELPSRDEAEIFSFALHKLLLESRKGKEIRNIRALAWMIGKRKAQSLHRHRMVATAWVKSEEILQASNDPGAAIRFEEEDLIRKVRAKVGEDTFSTAQEKAFRAPPKERQRICRARKRLSQAANELS